MIVTRTLISNAHFKPEMLPLILHKLSEDGWKPALLEAQRTFLELAGVTGTESIAPIQESMHRRRLPSNVIAGEVFFREDDMYYVTIDHSGGRFFHRPYAFSSSVGEDVERPKVEIGAVSSRRDGLDERLRNFTSQFETAFGFVADSEGVDAITFDWQEVHIGTPRLEKLVQMSDDRGKPKLDRAHLDADEVNAAQVLASRSTRDLLIELSEAGFAREKDILDRQGRCQNDIRSGLSQLRDVDLLTVEYLLECTQRGTPLTRLKDVEKHETPEMENLICPSCNRKFSEERLVEGYSLSELGREMCQQSHWMTVWVTRVLCNLGVPEDAVIWNVSEEGEEVDLLVDFLGELWIFELKDREFGAGDAYPLNYRQVRYRTTRAFVVTTEQVSPDAKRVFRELANESRRGRTRRSGPIYIEGLDTAEDVLRGAISKAALRHARQCLAVVTEISGYDFGSILATRFGEAIEPEEEEQYELPF